MRIMNISSKKSKSERTTLAGIEIAENQEHKYTTDVIKFNSLGGVPKGHPFIDREFPGAIKVREDPIKNMTEEELKEYFNREWNK